MESSYWEQELFGRPYDLLIVGGGFSGMASAYFVSKLRPSWKIAVVDRSTIQRIASTRNAGFACISSLSELMEDVRSHGWESTLTLIEKRWRGLEMMTDLLPAHTIDYQLAPSGELFFGGQQFPLSLYIDDLEMANEQLKPIIGAPYFRLEKDDSFINKFGSKTTGYIHHWKEGQLHPAKLVQAWRKKCAEEGIEYYEGIEVQDINKKTSGYTLKTNVLNFRTHRLLIAANGMSHELIPELEVQRAPNFVFVSEAISGLSWQGNLHAESGYIYARNIGDRILIGGGRHLLPKGIEGEIDSKYAHQVESYLAKCLLDFEIIKAPIKFEYKWSGYLGVGPEKEPIFDQMDNGLFVLARLSGMGVALSTALGYEMGQKIAAS